MIGPSHEPFAGRLARAAVKPLPIGIAVLTVFGSLLAPVVLVPGIAAWLLAVLITAYAAKPARRGPDVSHLPPSIQADLLDVNEALDRLRAAVRDVPPAHRPLFEGIEREAEEVRESVLRLGRQAGTLHRHLASSGAETLAAQAEGLRARLEHTTDESARREIEQSIKRVEARQAHREGLVGKLEQYRATLASLQATAEELADRAASLAAGAPLEYDMHDDQSAMRRITEMKASVAALEEVLGTETETL